MTYQDIIMRFLYEAVPTPHAPAEVKFEAIASAVFGTKQRRFGPMPSPEIQVTIRDVVRDAVNRGGEATINFFVPWGSRKQTDGQNLDILEFTALKQLRCLREELRRYGQESHFSFRIEDLTDEFLFGNFGSNILQIDEYKKAFIALVREVLPGAEAYCESQFVAPDIFFRDAKSYVPVFFQYLHHGTPVETLYDIGWQGSIPPEQRAYYADAYRVFYPNKDVNYEMAKYFAATLARTRLGATCAPVLPNYLTACFTHPIPGNPIHRKRLYYRTIPERHTNMHKSPWLAKGYCELSDDGNCTPRFVTKDTPELVPQTIKWQGIEIDAPYLAK